MACNRCSTSCTVSLPTPSSFPGFFRVLRGGFRLLVAISKVSGEELSSLRVAAKRIFYRFSCILPWTLEKVDKVKRERRRTKALLSWCNRIQVFLGKTGR